MKLFITCDADWEAKVDKVLDNLSSYGYKRFIEERSYGSSLDCVAIVLMCQNPNLNLKQRIRHSKKEKTLYIDIMLDLEQFLVINQSEKEKIVIKKILTEVPPIIAKYKFTDFDFSKFEKDLNQLFR